MKISINTLNSKRKYSSTPPCGHPAFVDTPPLWTLFARPVCFPYIILLNKFHCVQSVAHGHT